MERPNLIDKIHWLGHDSYRIDSEAIIYIDPWKLPPNSPAADLILVSHDHFDHCSLEDVERIRKTTTTILANPSAGEKLKPPVTIMRAGETHVVAGVTVQAVPAYNVGKRFHPKEAGHVGYILPIEGERLYFAGDTDHIPEMEGLACDVALLPVSGTYVMTAEEAAQAAGSIKPKVAVPMHYGGGVVGTAEDAERFRRLSPVPVVILQVESHR